MLKLTRCAVIICSSEKDKYKPIECICNYFYVKHASYNFEIKEQQVGNIQDFIQFSMFLYVCMLEKNLYRNVTDIFVCMVCPRTCVSMFLYFYAFCVQMNNIEMSRTSLFVWYSQESAFLCSLVFKETILKFSNSFNREHIYVDTLCRVHSVGFLLERLIYMLTACLQAQSSVMHTNNNDSTPFVGVVRRL